MEDTKKKVLDNQVVVGVVFVITAIILITAFVLMVALNVQKRGVDSSSDKVSSNYEAPWVYPPKTY